MTTLDGKVLAASVLKRLRTAIATHGVTPGLASILVGHDAASLLYLKVKAKACTQTGIHFERHDFPDSATEQEIRSRIEILNARKDIHGILVQLPLPDGLSADRVIAAIDPAKDVDGFHPVNLAALEHGDDQRLPVLLKAVMAFIKHAGWDVRGKTVAVLGKNDVFLRPFRSVFGAWGARVLTAASADPAVTTQADIVITALGQPRVLVGAMIKEGAMLLDIGISPTPSGVVGDVDAASVAPKASFLTPVPGGIGPMTVAMLLENTALAAGITLS